MNDSLGGGKWHKNPNSDCDAGSFLSAGRYGNPVQLFRQGGGLADVSTALIEFSALFDLGLRDVHVALPDYQSIFDSATTKTHSRELAKIRKRLDEERIHLAADERFII